MRYWLATLILLGVLLQPNPDLTGLMAHNPIGVARNAVSQRPMLAILIGLSLIAAGSVAVWLWRRKRRLRAARAQTGRYAPAIRMDPLDREFLPAALEIFETPPSPIAISGIWLICIVFATTLIWAYLGRLEIYAVATGRIEPDGRSKVVQPLDAGKIVTIAVENGSHVDAGDLLLELDPREAEADRQQQARDLESNSAEVARRRIAIDVAGSSRPTNATVIYPPGTSDEIQRRENGVLASDLGQLTSNRASVIAQKAERAATRDRLQASMAAREKLIALDKEQVDMLQTLNRTKSASRAQVIEKLQQYEAQVTAQVSDQGELEEVEAALTTLDRKLEETTAQFVADQTQKLEDANRRVDHLKGELVKAETRKERMRLTAPIAGTIQQLAVTTVGQVVAPAQALMTIVPSDAPIEIEALIQNQDIGFIEPGQPAVVKIESFPFTRFGTIDGTVVKVSRDAVDEREQTALDDPKSTAKPQIASTSTTEQTTGQNLVFPATISLAKRVMLVDGKEIPLSPGMAVTVEIRTGQRRALDYVLSPLREVTSSAGHER
jgi:membrane fusion protein, hemolysin D